MKILGIGFSLLIIQIFPLGWVVKKLSGGGMYGDIFKGIPPIWYHIFSLALSFLIAGLIVWFFLRKVRLSFRFPEKLPGQYWMVAGVLLFLLYLLPRFYASTIQGGGPSFLVMQYSPYFLIPSKVLLVIGAVKALLSATPIYAEDEK